MRTLAVLTFLLLTLRAESQIVSSTLRIVSTPEIFTPIMDSLYLAGDPNQWNPADSEFRFQMNGEYPELVVSGAQNEPFEFKITRGHSWSTVEANSDGSYMPNRSATYQEGVLEIEIDGWEEFPTPHTAQTNTIVLTSSFFMPELDRYRRIWMVLPSNYYLTNDSYPVIYMHDAQNLFSEGNSFVREWEVDESMLELEQTCLEAIVVGIDNGAELRIDEYAPWNNDQYGGGEGQTYIEFLVNTLKPFIDNEFRTIPDADHTGIFGSSLGALISCYAAKLYPEVFGKVGLFSPAFWFNPEIFDFVENAGVSENQRFYLIAGSNESASMVPLMEQMANTLTGQGHPAEHIFHTDHSDGAHSEWYWAREFPTAIEWLFCNESNLILNVENNNGLKTYPNPSKDSLTIELEGSMKHVEIRDMSGKTVFIRNNILSNRIQIQQNWPSGIYSILVVDEQGKSYNSLHTID